eukprot:g10744.t1
MYMYCLCLIFRSRVRSLLLTYYADLGNEDIEENTTIDGQGFDAATHVDECVHDMGLGDLLKYHDRLHREIKTLDSSLQSMVYDNYTKFIQVTDTLPAIRQCAKDMSDTIDGLKGSFQSVARLAGSLETELDSSRDEMRDMMH